MAEKIDYDIKTNRLCIPIDQVKLISATWDGEDHLIETSTGSFIIPIHHEITPVKADYIKCGWALIFEKYDRFK